MIIGSILDYYHGHPLVDDRCGFKVQNGCGLWESDLRSVAKTLQREAHDGHGLFAALILDKHGKELRVEEMCRVAKKARIERLLIVLGGPTGISSESEDELRRVLEEFTDVPLLRCSLPGGIMHSYYALATLFVFHDQGVLLPFLTQMAEDLGQTNMMAVRAVVAPAVAAATAAVERSLPARTNCADAEANRSDVASSPRPRQQNATEPPRLMLPEVPVAPGRAQADMPKPPPPPAQAASSGPPKARNALRPTPPPGPPPKSLLARAKGMPECTASATPSFRMQGVTASAALQHPEALKAAVSRFLGAPHAPPRQDAQAQEVMSAAGTPHRPMPVGVKGTDFSPAPLPLSTGLEMISIVKGTVAAEMQVASTENSAALVSTRGSIAQEFQNPVSIESLHERALAGSQAKASSFPS